MAFDVNEPQDTTKIRNLGNIIRPNWLAIQDGESSFLPKALNFNNRTPLGVANDPTAISDVVISYCKDDSSGNPQLYAIDPSSNIEQLTRFQDFTSSSNGYSYLPGNVLIQWGSATDTWDGTPTISFTKTFTGTPYSITANPLFVGTGIREFVQVSSLTTTTWTPRLIRNGGGNVTGSRTLYWMAIGPG